MTVWRENPTARIEERAGRWWHEDPADPAWVFLGFAPQPSNAWRCFWHHVHHGCLMRLPVGAVLLFSWRNRSQA